MNNQILSFLYHGEPNAFIISTKPDMGSDGSNRVLAMFISGEGDITISGHVDSLQNINISGSNVHNEMMSFNEKIVMPLETSLNTTPYSDNVKRDSIKDKIKTSFKTFIEEHSNSYSGLLMLYQQILKKDFA